MLARSGILGPFASALVTGIVFGLGFDTATQISAISLSAVASATAGVQVALVFAGFFAAGMIPLDTLDSMLLRSAFSKIFNTRGFRLMSYALSGTAMAVAISSSYGIVTKTEILPEWAGPTLAGGVIAASFGYGFIKGRKKSKEKSITTEADWDKMMHGQSTTLQDYADKKAETLASGVLTEQGKKEREEEK
jgi:high-affinity nickel-transport protein